MFEVSMIRGRIRLDLDEIANCVGVDYIALEMLHQSGPVNEHSTEERRKFST